MFTIQVENRDGMEWLEKDWFSRKLTTPVDQEVAVACDRHEINIEYDWTE